MGRHLRYRLSDVIDWETARLDDLHNPAQSSATTQPALGQTPDADSQDAHTRNVGIFR